jgi:hypothetical protein
VRKEERLIPSNQAGKTGKSEAKIARPLRVPDRGENPGRALNSVPYLLKFLKWVYY